MTSYLPGAIGVMTLATVALNDDPALWAQWGLAGVVVAYVLWRDNSRERRMAEAIDRHQEWVRSTLLTALERNTKAMERMAARFSLKDGEQ